MMNTRTLLASILAAGLLTGGAAVAQDKADSAFLRKAIQGDLAEVQMGNLAQQKATNSGVRSFGDTLTKDHSDNQKKAAALAQSLNVAPPTAPNAEQKKSYDQLSKLSGQKFDQDFVRHMVVDHEKDIAAYKKEAQSKNPQIAAFAKETLPTLEKHLQMAKDLQKQVSSAAR
jgi:putative membrane protein